MANEEQLRRRVNIGRAFTTASDTIATNAASSTGIDKRGWHALGLILPTLTSASVGAKVSSDNSTWYQLEDGQGNHLSLYTAGTANCAVSGGSAFEALAPWPYVMATTGAAQAASRALTWVLQG